MYLFLYNSLQWFGWVAVLADRVVHYDEPELSALGILFLYLFQTLAIMEVVHSVTGLVRASPITTIVQVVSRVQLILVHYHVEEAQHSSGLLPMIAAWGIVEVVRYLYLALNMFEAAPRWLSWLRYTCFYVLYPVGVYGEMKVLFAALPVLRETDILSIVLPNAFNFTFSFSAYVSWLLYVIYVPGLYVQYTHMMQQRRKVLFSNK